MEVEPNEHPKLKKAVVTLKKLDMFSQVPNKERRNERQKGKSDSLEESGDPSSESVSTGSGESNVVGTDDDDLEKKIQAFAIPVKKENAIINVRNNKSDVLKNSLESSKYGKKVGMNEKEKVDDKLEIKTSENEEAPAIKIGTVSNGTRKKKEKQNKAKTKLSNEEKKLPVEKRCLTPDQQNLQNIDKSSYGSKNITIKSSEHRLKNEKSKKGMNTFSVKKKMKEHSHQNLSESLSEILQKSAAENDEKSPVHFKKPLKMSHDKRNVAKLSSESSATVTKKRSMKNTDQKLSVDATQKAVLNGKSSASSSKSNLKAIINFRKPGILSKKRNILKSTNRDGSASSEQLRVSKDVTKKRQKNTKGRIDRSLKKDNTEEKTTKKRSPERKTDIERKRKHTKDSSIPKDDNKQQKRRKLVDVTKNNDKTSISAEKHKILNNKAHNLLEKPIPDTKVETNCSDVLDDGEELFEKIYDILEDSHKIIELAEKKNSQAFKLHPYLQKIVSPSREIIFTPHLSVFKPNLLKKHSKFPCDSKGTVPYQKLWKWSHYVKMPSDMWSLHKHPNGNWVVVFHISEKSPFPELIIDKCVIFKETASPCVKIYGKDVLALSSENELKTLGNVCSFLKHIHDISLCEGSLLSTEEESNKNCELYTDEKVSMPYNCKFCQSI